MRYIQEGADNQAPKKEKKEAPKKAGTKDYDYKNLEGGKKIPTQGGWK